MREGELSRGLIAGMVLFTASGALLLGEGVASGSWPAIIAGGAVAVVWPWGVAARLIRRRRMDPYWEGPPDAWPDDEPWPPSVPRERVITLTMKPPGLADRIWYRRLGLDLPRSIGRSPNHPRLSQWVRLLPYSWRPVHRWYARHAGFYWLPCPLCGREFGGHEDGASIPHWDGEPGHAKLICSACTRGHQVTFG